MGLIFEEKKIPKKYMYPQSPDPKTLFLSILMRFVVENRGPLRCWGGPVKFFFLPKHQGGPKEHFFFLSSRILLDFVIHEVN